MKNEEIILASASPRRRELFALFNLPYRCVSADLDESQLPGEDPTSYVQRLAQQKGQSVSDAGWVVSADTIVVFEGRVLGKPASANEARQMLTCLRGKPHSALTALALRQPATGQLLQSLCATEVTMRDYSDAEIEGYLQSGDFRDKAGAYAIQHKAFHPVRAIQGCYAIVMGLPLCHLACLLQAAGIKANYLAVDDRRGVVDPNAPSLAGNHMITAIEIPPGVQDSRLRAMATAAGRRYLIFDPTNERTAVGNLPAYEQGSYGILAAGGDSQILPLPVLDPDANLNITTGTFTLQPDGALTGEVRSSHQGPDGAEYRMFLKYTNDKERHEYWEKMIAADLPGVELQNFTFNQPADLNQPLEIHYTIASRQFAHQAGPLLLIRPRVLVSHSAFFDDKPRTVAIDLGSTGHWHESFDIALPKGYVVDETPDPAEVNSEFLSYRSAITVKNGILHYECDYQVRQVELPASKAFEFRRVESAILRDEKATAVLKKAPDLSAAQPQQARQAQSAQ
jgi:MAF protein